MHDTIRSRDAQLEKFHQKSQDILFLTSLISLVETQFNRPNDAKAMRDLQAVLLKDLKEGHDV